MPLVDHACESHDSLHEREWPQQRIRAHRVLFSWARIMYFTCPNSNRNGLTPFNSRVTPAIALPLQFSLAGGGDERNCRPSATFKPACPFVFLFFPLFFLYSFFFWKNSNGIRLQSLREVA